MPKRPRLLMVLGLASVLCVPASARAQASRRITVEYSNAQLSRVAESFAAFSGQSIVLASDIGDPTVTSAVKNVDWKPGLDAILAEQGLIARPDTTGGLRIERERRLTVEYQNADLSDVVSAFAAFSGRRIVLAPVVADRRVTASLENVDWQRALDQTLATLGLVARADSAGVFRVQPVSAR